MNAKSSLFSGDILSCQRELTGLVKGKKTVSGELVEQISSMVMTFAHDSFIPVEYSEKLLTGIGNFMEIHSEDEKSYVVFARSTQFIEALVGIVNAFECRLTLGQSQTTNSSSFASHCCYELTLFMLLGLLDKTQILKAFVKSVSVDVLHSLLTAIGTIIVHDYLYLTQEVGLEIISRLCHFFVQQDPAGFDTITADLPLTLRDAVSDASAIPDLLRDMRPLLNELNKNNPNVFSFAAQSFRVATTWKKVDTERTLDAGGYLDLCRDCVCYNLLDEEVLVRFDYQTIQRVHFEAQTNSIQIVLHSCPKKLRQLLKKEELPPADRCPTLILQFPQHSTALGELKSVLELRMIEHESIKLLDNHKYSVVSSKDQSPEAVSVALARLKQLDSDPHTSSAVPRVSPHSSSTHMPPPVGTAGRKNNANTNNTTPKGKGRGKIKKGEPQHEDSPSSISSPDMDVTDTSQEHLPKHKPAPDTLVQMAINNTGHSGGVNKAKVSGNAGRGRGAGAVDSLSHLRPPLINTTTTTATTTNTAATTGTTAAPRGRPNKKTATAATAAATATTASGAKQTTTKNNSNKKNTTTTTSSKGKPSFTIYEDNPNTTTNTASKIGTSDMNNYDNYDTYDNTMDNHINNHMDTSMGNAGDDFGFGDVYPETSHMYTPPLTSANDNPTAKKGTAQEPATPAATARKPSAFAASIAKTVASTTENNPANTNTTTTSNKKKATAKGKALQPVSASALNTRAGGAQTEPVEEAPDAEMTTPVPTTKKSLRSRTTITNATATGTTATSTKAKPTTSTDSPALTSDNLLHNNTTTPGAINLSQHSTHTTHTTSSNKRKFGRAFHPQPVPLLPLDSAARSVVSAVDWMSINDDSSSSEECEGNKKARKNRATAVKEKENEKAKQQQQTKGARGKPPLPSATKMKPLTTTTTTTTSTAKKRGGRPPLPTTRSPSPAASRPTTNITANAIQNTTTGPGFTIYDDYSKAGKANSIAGSVTGSVAGSVAGSTAGVRRSSFAMSLDLIHGKKPTTTAATANTIASTTASVTKTYATTTINTTNNNTSANTASKPAKLNLVASTAEKSDRPPKVPAASKPVPAATVSSKNCSSDVLYDNPDGNNNNNNYDDYGMDYADYGGSGMYDVDVSNTMEGSHLAAYHDTSFAYEAAQASPLRDTTTTRTANQHSWRPLSTTTTTAAKQNKHATDFPPVIDTDTGVTFPTTAAAAAPKTTTAGSGMSLMMQQLQATRAELSNNYKHTLTTTANINTTSHIPIDPSTTVDELPHLQVPTFSQMLQGSSQPNSQSSSVGDNRDIKDNTDSVVGEKHLLDVSGPLSKRTRSGNQSNYHNETAYNTATNANASRNKKATTTSTRNKNTTKRTRSHYGSDSDDARSVHSNTHTSKSDKYSMLEKLVQSVGSRVDSSESSQGGDSNSSSGSSLEENEVVAALLAEIVKMQKERASRKRSRMLASVGETARAQVGCFLQQWRSFTDQHCAEHQRTTNAALESLCGRADTLCSTLGAECEEMGKRDTQRVSALQALEKDSVALRSEIATLLSQYKNEDAAVRTELQGLRNRTLDTARKTLNMHRDTRQHASKNQKEELLKALQAM